MEKIKKNIRTYINPKKGQVMIRVRWMNKQREVGITTGAYADPSKWNSETQMAKLNTTHKVGKQQWSARQINSRISQFIECIEAVFAEAELRGEIPETEQVKQKVNDLQGRLLKEEEEQTIKVKYSLKDAFKLFLKERPIECVWADDTHEKYDQLWTHLKESNPGLTFDTLNKHALNNLKMWFIERGYHNSTIKKQFLFLKTILRWFEENEIAPIKKEVMNYKPNIIAPPKVVIFLTKAELDKFAAQEFPKDKPALERARDFFVFMSCTSLRLSDFSALKKANCTEGYIDIYTKKTKDKLHIPIVDLAQKIIDKYKDYEGETLFPVPSGQKFNDALKEAAEYTGLYREIEMTHYCGAERRSEIVRLCDIISAHCARRTFVCNSLAMGIPPTVVMSCTGHSSYNSMRPYIEVADVTQQREMERWNAYDVRQTLHKLIDEADSITLREIEHFLTKKAV